MSYVAMLGDVIEQLKTMDDECVDSIITDPPYNVKLANWDAFSTNKEYGDWCKQWATECYRVLKPNGSILSFGGTRTYHWLACAIEDSGFVTRDMLEWIYWASFAKGKNLKPGHEPIYYGVKGNNVSELTFNIDDCRIPMDRKQTTAIEQWMLPQQPIKPRTDIWSKKSSSVGKKYNAVVGKKEKAWKHTTNKPHSGGRVPYNVLTSYNLDTPTNFIDIKKPRGIESIKGHPTQKPIKLLQWLIKLVTNENDIILDPFSGTGTTGEAAILLNRHCILIEKENDYMNIINDRLHKLK